MPEFFSMFGEHGCFRPVSNATFHETTSLIEDAIGYCRTNEIRGLLIDIRRLTGFAPPSIADRFWSISKWAETAGGNVIVSMLAPPAMILPDKLGVTMAFNRGLQCEAFPDEAGAIAWLQAAFRD